MYLVTVDWIIFIAYLLFVFVIGLWVTKKAGKDLQSYFVASRSLPWWWLGISIIATTFAADTPLAITGITANSGISGNWFWWSWAITYIMVSVFFAERWRRSNVLTDVEFIELRYSGKAAAFLRGFKATYFGVIINCFILGWVITAAVKIASPFIDWSLIFPEQIYQTIEHIYPSFLLFKDDLNASLTIMALLLIVVLYSSLGGIRGVILTDLFQFAIAIVSSVVFAVLAVNHVGGLGEMMHQLDVLYGSEQASYLTELFPSIDNPYLPISVFLIYVFVQWWVRYDSDGTGYIAQRINTAQSGEDAKKGALLFSIAFIALRTWPWIMVALVTLIVFPLDNPGMILEQGSLLAGDRELGYPLLMKAILPVGLLGLTFTSLMAAFMSTVDTHINWGASYLANDVYKRFIAPKATARQLVRFSRMVVCVIMILAVLVASQMNSISGAWKFFINAASGLGIAQIMRWIWWRANAWTEISAMVTALFSTLFFSFYPLSNSAHVATYELAVIAAITMCVAIVITLLTKPVSSTHLRLFVERCSPIGFWPEQVVPATAPSRKETLNSIVQWIFALVGSYCALFSIGYFLLLQPVKGIVSTVVGVVAFVLFWKISGNSGKK